MVKKTALHTPKNPSVSSAQGHKLCRGTLRLQNCIREEEKAVLEGWCVFFGWTVLLMLPASPSAPGAPCRCSGLPSTRRSICRLLFSRNTWKGHPVPLLMGAEWKNPEITGKQECATVTDSLRFSGSSPDITILQNANGISWESWYLSSAIAQLLNKFCYCRNRAGLDHSCFLKTSIRTQSTFAFARSTKAVLEAEPCNSQVWSLPPNSGYLHLLLWVSFVPIYSCRFWRMNLRLNSVCITQDWTHPSADLMANISQETITKQETQAFLPKDQLTVSTQLSSSCIYIMFIASWSIFVRQPNCFKISSVLCIPKVNYIVGWEQTEPNTPTNTHTWFAQINSTHLLSVV